MFTLLVFVLYIILTYTAVAAEGVLTFSEFKSYSILAILTSVVIAFAVHGICMLFNKNFFF